MTHLRCWFCKKLDHKKRNCWSAHPEKNPFLDLKQPAAETTILADNADTMTSSAVTYETKPPQAVPEGIERFRKDFKQHMKLCPPSKHDIDIVGQNGCAFLTVLDPDTRKILYKHFFQDPSFAFTYDFQILNASASKRLGRNVLLIFTYAYSCRLLLACKTVYQEGLRLYYTHTPLSMVGNPNTIVPIALLRQLCQQVHVRDDSLRWNFGQFANLNSIVIGGREGFVQHAEEEIDEESAHTDDFILEKYRTGAKKFLEDMRALERRTEATIKIEAGVLLTRKSGVNTSSLVYFLANSSASVLKDRQ